MLIGYARVSTQDQNLDLQCDALKAAGCEQVYEDKISGVKAARPGLDKALEHLRTRDTLVVWKLDRLGRSVMHLIETVEALEKRGVQFRSLQESIDTTTPTGKAFFHIVATFAQLGRDIIRENTRAGLVAARARGKMGGRKPVMDDKKKAMAMALRADPKRPVSEICKALNISRATFYRYTKPESSEVLSTSV